MQRIVVLNPKGGSGKTTIAINLASYFAQRGEQVTLMDGDPQGSATRWVRKRQPNQPGIQLIAAHERDLRTTRSFQLRIPDGTERLIVDTPAAVEAPQMPEITRLADKILVPVLPSDIDIHACAKCISNLLLVAKIKRADNRLGIIANRVRRNTITYQSLTRFLETLDIPIVTVLRDSQNYVRGAELGLGLHEMKNYQAGEDLEQWTSMLAWLAEPSRVPGVTPMGVPIPTLQASALQAPTLQGAALQGAPQGVANGAAQSAPQTAPVQATGLQGAGVQGPAPQNTGARTTWIKV
jgi:chromosome partitioning protein